jgi:putative peptide maturation dehydrogenase
MRVRRCSTLLIEPQERLAFDFSVLASGGTGLKHVMEWIAHVPYLGREVVLSLAEVAMLGSISPSEWVAENEVRASHPQDIVSDLIGKGLLIVEGSESSLRDDKFRDTHWRGVSACSHYASRWKGIDTEEAEKQSARYTNENTLQRLGPAPPAVRERTAPSERRHLPRRSDASFLDALLSKRVTCRNFDASQSLSLSHFSAVLQSVFGARAVQDYAPTVHLIKKGVPSAGGMHPTEAYLLIRDVEGLSAGLYHYHPIDHALEPIQLMGEAEAASCARRFVAGQTYFVDAHALAVPTSRYWRNFWKYRNHAKVYRTLILDIGHLSQTLYLAATELGLGAFITAAINEVDIEEAFGLDPLEEGPLAVCGFGIRAPERKEVEFDPLGAVWPAT